MKRAYYSDSIEEFLDAEPDRISGELSRHGECALLQTQKDAWLEQNSGGFLRFIRKEYQDLPPVPRIMDPYWLQGMLETDSKKFGVIQYVNKLPSLDILLSSYEDLSAMDADYEDGRNRNAPGEKTGG